MPAEQFGGQMLTLSFILPAHYASPLIDADAIDVDILGRVASSYEALKSPQFRVLRYLSLCYHIW